MVITRGIRCSCFLISLGLRGRFFPLILSVLRRYLGVCRSGERVICYTFACCTPPLPPSSFNVNATCVGMRGEERAGDKSLDCSLPNSTSTTSKMALKMSCLASFLFFPLPLYSLGGQGKKNGSIRGIYTSGTKELQCRIRKDNLKFPYPMTLSRSTSDVRTSRSLSILAILELFLVSLLIVS